MAGGGPTTSRPRSASRSCCSASSPRSRRLELVTGIIILPQRQTALVAKQAAEVDLLTGGRFRLGIGLGWNEVEYEALGQDFATRGQRADEQAGLLRRLWTEPSVTHAGRFDRVTGAGLAPRPVQRPIPVWFGAQSAPAYRRAGRLADGWFPQVRPGPELEAARAQVDQAAAQAGRDPAAIGMEGRVSWRGDPGQLAGRGPAGGEQAGATHLSVNTMGAGLATVDGHLAALAAAAAALGLAAGLTRPDSDQHASSHREDQPRDRRVRRPALGHGHQAVAGHAPGDGAGRGR